MSGPRTSTGLSALAILLIGGCSESPHVRLPAEALDHAIGGAIGDPSTCVVLVDPATHKVAYRYGAAFNCVRGLPACDRAGTMSANQAVELAGVPGGRAVSCDSNADGSRQVGWAEGRATTSKGVFLYSVVMEGERALPGHEIAARLEGAIKHAGL